MKKFAIGLVALLVMAGFAASAMAMTTGSLSVTWNNVVGANYEWREGGVGSWVGKTVNAGWATGYFDANGALPPPTRNLGNVWCVDLYNWSGSPWGAEQWTQADGAASEFAWVNPTADDGKRSAAGLGQAAYLANNHGWELAALPINAASNSKKNALQMAIWTAAYGTAQFRYVSGGDVDVAQYNTYLAEIEAGRSAAQYEWYDNNDSGQYYQDFMNDVPEPGSVILLSSVLLGAAALGWRKRK